MGAMSSFLVYETTGKHPDDHHEYQAQDNRAALVLFKREYEIAGYITQVAAGKRYVLDAGDGAVWIADRI